MGLVVYLKDNDKSTMKNSQIWSEASKNNILYFALLQALHEHETRYKNRFGGKDT